jgi:hypothetical protein
VQVAYGCRGEARIDQQLEPWTDRGRGHPSSFRSAEASPATRAEGRPRAGFARA